jgi:ubiquinone/menaquinone biosynthesis C-methylase UbiE
MKRVVIPELLDSDSGTPKEIQDSLADLSTINRYFGGHRTTCRLLGEVARRAGKTNLTFLDVGGGTGDFVQAIDHDLRRDGLQLRATVLDRIPAHLSNESRNGLFRISGDALTLPFREQSYDVVGSNLFCHHLEPEQLVRFIDEALRVSKIGVIVNDLRRNYFHLVAIYAGFLFYRSRMTRHDAPASVRRAYTATEWKSLVSQSKASKITIDHHYFQRLGIIAWR